MWKRVLKFIYVLTLIGSVCSYVNSENTYMYNSQNSKASYVNHHLARFRHQMTTVRPRTLTSSYHRNHQIHNLFTTEATTRPGPSNDHHKFRHTRFPKIDSLLTKISRMESENKDAPRHPQRWTQTESPPSRITTKSTKDSDDDLFGENYDDDDSDFDEEDALEIPARLKKLENIHDGVTADWENDEDEDDSDDDEDGMQAEEATTAMPSLTDYKWRHYGTRSRVEESRRNHRFPSQSNDYNELNAAVQHALRINSEGGCKVPKARVISVQHVYPDASKTYIPHCTVLHQCGDDAGCCRAESLTCAPKHTNRVELYFYTTAFGHAGNKVEKLAFYNHTECECVEKKLLKSREHSQESRHHLRPGMALRAAPEPSHQPAPETIIRHRRPQTKYGGSDKELTRCRCPELYSSHSTHSGHCKCDCDVGNRDCIRIRRGKEYFSLKDRKCINNGQCGNPACEFGSYIRQSGRCPRKQEKFDFFSRGSPK